MPVQWLQANNKRGFLGEFNAKAPASSSACKDAVYAVLDRMCHKTVNTVTKYLELIFTLSLSLL